MPEMPDLYEIPEVPELLEETVSATLIITKKPGVIKVSTGIGDSDGFPAFDEDADMYVVKKDPKWGFRMTGGAEFHMPLTVFQVSEGSLAERGGIKLGDIITQINGIDASNLSLAQAHEIINSSEIDLALLIKSDFCSMDDEESVDKQTNPEEKTVNLHIPVLKPPEPPREFRPTPLLDRRIWHPIMWENPPPTNIEEEKEEELPHHRIIRNIKRFFKETEDKPDLRKKHVEDMLSVLPGASKDV